MLFVYKWSNVWHNIFAVAQSFLVVNSTHKSIHLIWLSFSVCYLRVCVGVCICVSISLLSIYLYLSLFYLFYLSLLYLFCMYFSLSLVRVFWKGVKKNTNSLTLSQWLHFSVYSLVHLLLWTYMETHMQSALVLYDVWQYQYCFMCECS